MKVTFVVRFDAGMLMGGAEIRVERTRKALAAVGIEASYYHPHDRTIDGQLVHFFGNFDYYWYIAEHCLQRQIPYICSPIFMGQEGIGLRVKGVRRRLFSRHYHRRLHALYSNAARLVVLNDIEERRLKSYFGGRLSPTVSIPNGIERYDPAMAETFRDRTGVRGPFLLHVGRFEGGKNQLGVIRALRDTNYRMVFIGRSQDDDYLRQCMREAPANALFLLDLEADDPVLHGAYEAAHVFCLPSYEEGMSNAVLEAGAAGAPIVTGDSWGAERFFAPWVRTVKVEDAKALRSAITAAWDSDHDRCAERRFFERYSWPAVANQIGATYQDVIGCTSQNPVYADGLSASLL